MSLPLYLNNIILEYITNEKYQPVINHINQIQDNKKFIQAINRFHDHYRYFRPFIMLIFTLCYLILVI